MLKEYSDMVKKMYFCYVNRRVLRPLRIMLNIYRNEDEFKSIWNVPSEDFTKSGICYCVVVLYSIDAISYEEYETLYYYIQNNLDDHHFSWKMGEKEPRIGWLESQIEYLENNNKNKRK